MLTDDDLTRQLGAAFRSQTEDLAYAGRVPAPRSAVVLGVPLVATAATVAALAGVWATTSDSDAPHTPPAPGPTATTPTEDGPELVTDTFEVAGLSFAVPPNREVTVAELLRIHYRGVDEVPASARELELTPPPRAWVGTDSESGEAVLYFQSPERFDGRLTAILSPDFTEAEMEHMLLRAFAD